jgi:hypothetical protein
LLKPACSTIRWYEPTGTPGTVKLPVLVVTVSNFVPVFGFVNVICAPGIRDPVVSETVPVTVPPVWAKAIEDRDKNKEAIGRSFTDTST